ncbi:MAG TPA: single-stranded-DNA-specific exonuclease RecJ [Terriglobales bacterium]|nr:single-stranded-DNA-specific exonuclease RecJ [Terriglobales bacterium]
MRWALRNADEAVVRTLTTELKLSPIVARLLAARDITAPEKAQKFLLPILSDLHSPYLMLGMKTAVERLQSAIENREPVLIYGDYDVDGTTAVVILKTTIEILGGITHFHVPHRIRDGYGMKEDVIERAAAEGVRLIISVDTGIRAFAAAETARRVGVDLIVTDHHLPETHEGVPHALAVLNPNQPGCEYPCKELCGAGVAFKVAQALLEAAGRDRLLPSFIKLVAIATIADAVPLIGENRILAKIGLKGLQDPRNIGLKTILEIAGVDISRPVGTGEIAFRVAPRLNAAGRMDVAEDVIKLFSVKDPAEARAIAQKLHDLNGDRQAEEARILEEIHAALAANPEMRDAYCIVVDGDGWHRGVIGITATRVVERYCRPAIVLSRDGEDAHGSGRSIRGFHLLDALESCREVFTRFGGHAHAVGLGLPCERIAELRSRLDAYARGRLTPEDFIPVLDYDADVNLNEVSETLYDSIQQLQPFGMGNPEPVFGAHGINVVVPPKVLKEKHLKLRLAQQNGGGRQKSWQAMAWRMAERLATDPIVVGDSIDIAFTLEHNDHPDFGGLEFRLCDFRRTAVATAQ